MAEITALTAQKKNKNRVNLFLDGEYFCSLDAAAAVSARLKPGNETTEKELKEVVFRSECASALDRALKYLGIKPSSEYQIRQYLLEKGYDEETVEITSARLLELNYLDDKAVAAAYVRSSADRYGNGLMRFKLKEKGIKSDIIKEVLPSPDKEAEAAVSLAEKYLKNNPPDRKKLYSHLFNKGFSADSISEAVKLIKEEQ